MAYNGPKAPPRAKHTLDHSKLDITAPVPDSNGNPDPKKRSSLKWAFHNNNPRITVFTNVPGDEKDYGKIQAELDLPIFNGFLEMLQAAIDGPRDTKSKIENKNFIYPGGQRSKEPVVVSELWVGKDKDGCVWICVSKRDRPRIKFIIGSKHYYHEFVHGDGTPYSAEETSVMMARAYLRMLTVLMNQMAIAHYKEPEKKEDNGNGGGYNRNGGGNNGGGGGYTRSAPATPGDDEEIPF